MNVSVVVVYVSGGHDRTKEEATKQYFDVSQLYIHRRYQTDTGYGHDIAVIRLSRPAFLNEAVGLVCLPKQNHRVAIDKMCYLTGDFRLVDEQYFYFMKWPPLWRRAAFCNTRF